MLTITNPAIPLSELRNRMESVFGDVFRDSADWLPNLPWAPRTFPALNLWEDEHNVFVEAELPGLKMEDLEVSVLGDELTIHGQRKSDKSEDAVYHRRERGTGDFTRLIRLPVSINPDQVDASLCCGVLTVKLGKAEQAKPRRIEVKVNGK